MLLIADGDIQNKSTRSQVLASELGKEIIVELCVVFVEVKL